MLNVKQEKFIQNIVKGMSQREAYKEAYNAKYKDDAIDNKASKLFNKEEVQARYKELIEELKSEAIMSAKERMIWLSGVVTNENREEVYIKDNENNDAFFIGSQNADLNTKMKAIDIMNKMSGEYKTILDGNVGIVKLEDVL